MFLMPDGRFRLPGDQFLTPCSVVDEALCVQMLRCKSGVVNRPRDVRLNVRNGSKAATSTLAEEWV